MNELTLLLMLLGNTLSLADIETRPLTNVNKPARDTGQPRHFN